MKLKQTNASAHLVQYRFIKIREGSPEGMRRLRREGFVKEMHEVICAG